MELDPLLAVVVGAAIAILCLGVVLRQLRQPYVIGYILVGVVLANFSNNILGIRDIIFQFGSLGVVLLLFFIGMHISIPSLVARWRVAVLGTFLQTIATVGVVWVLGAALGWPLRQIVLLGFVVSLSSTAVVLKVLAERKELRTKVGQNVLGILLVQDLAVIPMFIVLDVMGGESYSSLNVLLQVVGFLLIVGLVVWIKRQRRFKLPFAGLIKNDHELQVFVAILLCFGLALISGLFGLSTALGAFVAGLIVASADATSWVQKHLNSLHVIFVAVFFIYIGMLIDLHFFIAHWWLILLLVLAAFAANTAINTLVIRLLGDNWKESFYAGGLLSQIGEFSFLLGTVGFKSGIISDTTYQMVISIIALTLLLSPLWISLIKKAVRIDADYIFELPSRLGRALRGK